jgi:hypothetical protein
VSLRPRRKTDVPAKLMAFGDPVVQRFSSRSAPYRRGTSGQAATRRGIIANHDEQARTAPDIAADTSDRQHLSDRVRWALDRRARALPTRRHT